MSESELEGLQPSSDVAAVTPDLEGVQESDASEPEDAFVYEDEGVAE